MLANIDPNLLIDQEWTGTFFPPGRLDLSFAGRLRYSPTQGLQLEFARQMSKEDEEQKWAFLHGHTSKGVPLTLLGDFSSEGNGYSFSHGMSYWTSAGYHFQYAIFGYHFEEADTFDTFDFDLSGVQDFFGTEGMIDRTPHSMVEVVTSNNDVGKICVIHSSKMKFVGGDLKGVFHAENSEALEELQLAYDEVRDRHPDFLPFVKRRTDYLLRFVPAQELRVHDARKVIESVADLFAMLSFEPVKLKALSATARDNEGKPYVMKVFPSMFNDHATIKRSTSERSFHRLPLNNTDVDLGQLISNWLRHADSYSTVSSLLQSKVDVTSEHEIHGNIVLAATQLERIAIQHGATARKQKYEYGLKNHASARLRNRIAVLLGCKEEDVGDAISDLRNEIAHVGRPRMLLSKIDPGRQYKISTALQTVIIGYALEQMGASVIARDKYQESLFW